LGYAEAKEERKMKCDLCDGEYREKTVVRNYKWCGKTIVIEDVPALVCDRCGDTLIREETVAAIDELLKKEAAPREYAPVYRFPAKVA
jgi:YgiT-type zinc finger domain-containing protein